MHNVEFRRNDSTAVREQITKRGFTVEKVAEQTGIADLAQRLTEDKIYMSMNSPP